MDHGNRKSGPGDLREVSKPLAESNTEPTGKKPAQPVKTTCVRFTPEEYREIHVASIVYGKSIPDLLKSVFFCNPPKQPVVSDENARAIIGALNRIGNNVNQLARQVNSGFREGFIVAFDDVRDDMRALKNFAVGLCGNR